MVHQMYKTTENWSPSSLFRGDTYEKGFNSSPSKLLGNHFQVSKLGRSWKFSGKGSFSDGKTSARPDSRLTNERLKARHTYLVFGSSLDIFKMLFKISSRVLHIQLFPGIGSWIFAIRQANHRSNKPFLSTESQALDFAVLVLGFLHGTSKCWQAAGLDFLSYFHSKRPFGQYILMDFRGLSALAEAQCNSQCRNDTHTKKRSKQNLYNICICTCM